MERYTVAFDGDRVFVTQDSGEWLDYLFNLGITNPGRAGFQFPDEDDVDGKIIEWFVA